MDYRKIPKTGLEVSTIAIGPSKLHQLNEGQTVALFDYAQSQGINLVDAAMSYHAPMEHYRTALAGRRGDFHLQLHLGMDYSSGEYARAYDLESIQRSLDYQLRTIGTDYADIALFHCIDSLEDFEKVMANGAFAYALDLKKAGVIRNLGFSSHTVDVCNKFLATGEMEAFMFSINAAYDLDPAASDPYTDSAGDALTMAQQRQKLYQDCARMGVGITVMKAYGAGKLLDASTSPFGQAMTVPQCLQYALDRPAVLSCILGVSSQKELEEAVAFYQSTPQQRDYSMISSLPHSALTGTCVYCNHCMPCPKGIDIGKSNKFLDLHLLGDAMAKEHYNSLAATASQCVGCGICEKRCPFGVPIREKMQQVKAAFGK